MSHRERPAGGRISDFTVLKRIKPRFYDTMWYNLRGRISDFTPILITVVRAFAQGSLTAMVGPEQIELGLSWGHSIAPSALRAARSRAKSVKYKLQLTRPPAPPEAEPLDVYVYTARVLSLKSRPHGNA